MFYSQGTLSAIFFLNQNISKQTRESPGTACQQEIHETSLVRASRQQKKTTTVVIFYLTANRYFPNFL